MMGRGSEMGALNCPPFCADKVTSAGWPEAQWGGPAVLHAHVTNSRFMKTSLCANAVWDILTVICHPHLSALTRMFP